MIKNIIFKSIDELAKNSGLMSYERVKNIYLHSEPFTLENGLATPTMKIKRDQVRRQFKKIIDNLYSELKRQRSKI
jgi:long-chain acyl-CoA synthetase